MPGDPDESRIIELVLQHGPPGGRHRPPRSRAAGPGDDAAVVADGEVVTCDLMVEGVHWDDRLSPEDVGWKLAAVNASDIGAMGCRSTWAVLALSLPVPVDMAWVEDFARGLGKGLRACGASLVGGDTTRSPGPRFLSLTLAGSGIALCGRHGARVGDRIWVSGTLGEAAAGFLDGQPDGLAWLRRPMPPVALGPELAERSLAHAMMDLSDGLATDLPRLCKRSGVGAIIDPESLPVGPAVGRLPASKRLSRQVSFGDDYQLLFTADARQDDAIASLGAALQLQLTPIGHIVAGSEVRLRGRSWPSATFAHFPRAPVSEPSR